MIRKLSYWILGITFVIVASILIVEILMSEPEKEEVIPKIPEKKFGKIFDL